MNTTSEKVAPTSAEKEAQDAVTEFKKKEPASTPLPARGNDEVMSQQERTS